VFGAFASLLGGRSRFAYSLLGGRSRFAYSLLGGRSRYGYTLLKGWFHFAYSILKGRRVRFGHVIIFVIKNIIFMTSVSFYLIDCIKV